MSGDVGRAGEPEEALAPAPCRVLVVDDEPDLRESVAWRLEQAGFEVTYVADGASALAAIRVRPPDVLLLDVVLPGVGGLDVLREARRSSDEMAIILISGKSDETDRVVGLEIGADDFVVKPFSPRELVARIRSVLRRARTPDRPVETGALQAGDLVVEPTARRVTVRGEAVSLSAKEYELLALLAGEPDRAFTRAELIDRVWPTTQATNPQATLTEHISRLRRKIEADPAHPRRIVTVRGVGYRLEP